MRPNTVWIFLLLAAGPGLAQDPAGPGTPGPEGPATDHLVPALVSGPRELFLKGVALVESGAVGQAKTVFTALTLAYPDLPEPWVNLAVLQAAEGDEAAAAASAEAALLAHPVCSAAFRLELLRDLVTVPPVAAEGREAAPRTAGGVPAVAPAAAADRATGSPSEEARTAAAMVHAWADAWSQQRADDYLAFYGRTFRPPGGADRGRWEAERRERLTRPRLIEVEVSGLEVEVTSPGRAVATFVQSYRSDTFTDVVRKTLELARMGDTWRITAETASP